MSDITSFQHDLLYAIAELDQPPGLAIKYELEDDYKSQIDNEQLYSNLDALVNKGFVEKGELDQHTDYYRLTRRGRREIETRRN